MVPSLTTLSHFTLCLAFNIFVHVCQSVTSLGCLIHSQQHCYNIKQAFKLSFVCVRVYMHVCVCVCVCVSVCVCVWCVSVHTHCRFWHKQRMKTRLWLDAATVHIIHHLLKHIPVLHCNPTSQTHLSMLHINFSNMSQFSIASVTQLVKYTCKYYTSSSETWPTPSSPL